MVQKRLKSRSARILTKKNKISEIEIESAIEEILNYVKAKNNIVNGKHSIDRPLVDLLNELYAKADSRSLLKINLLDNEFQSDIMWLYSQLSIFSKKNAIERASLRIKSAIWALCLFKADAEKVINKAITELINSVSEEDKSYENE